MWMGKVLLRCLKIFSINEVREDVARGMFHVHNDL